ncbi:uncharacterized protein LOC115243072 [Formica exsecta]|uniref:uncharacterized protein LOC115243072 n=1 Tax=Formica exsecta TaxID=72781 RepID=UPI0011419780|nr:uncharacterized protein LOC115243072 [Formica exsecta]
MLDAWWTFNEHFRYVVEKTSRVARALNRLMPNLRGPDERRRRLYANVLLSVMLYGAPVWGNELNSSKRRAALETEHYRLCAEWRDQLDRPNTPGEFTKLAIVPRLEAWLSRRSGSMSFHITQIMTGHGCFAKFLHRIGRRENSSCDFCGEEVDDVYHIIRDCPAWDPERIRLKRKLGLARDFTLGDVIEAITGSGERWAAFSAFAEKAADKAAAMARDGGCAAEDIRVGDIKWPGHCVGAMPIKGRQ